jgi:hypothetical protein
MPNLIRTITVNSIVGCLTIPALFTAQAAMGASFRFTQNYRLADDFRQGGGTLSGFFSGEDLNNDGKLACQLNSSQCELSAFTAVFNGVLEGSVPEYGFERQKVEEVWKFPTLYSFDFNFDLATNSLALDTSTLRDNNPGGAGTSILFIGSSPSYEGFMELEPGGTLNLDGVSVDKPTFTQVPEPTTILGSLVCGYLGLQLKRRKKVHSSKSKI